jgi:lysophospholipase L1-like esterase
VARDKRVDHKNYGVMAGFVRYLPYKKLYDTSKVFTATLNISTNPKAGPNATGYTDLKIFYGGSRRRTWCEFYDGPALMGADSLKAGGDFNVREFKVAKGSLNHSLKFKSKDSPDIYGISLENGSVIYVDNIALRGSSGTFFHQINNTQLKTFYDYLNVKLVILQFGGNALPAIENDTMARNYAGYLQGQLIILKRLLPDASILFVGPSDMCIKEGTDYVTYPQLELLRDEIKKVVLSSGCAFYDMYDSMGGKNSMVSWVDQKLAASDYIHFSYQGARKISALLYAAIMDDYNNFLKHNN